MLIENESQYIDVNKIQSHNKLSQINNNNNYINQTGNKPIIKERNDEKEMKANNNLTISKEGDLLIQNIKANICEIRNNIDQVYCNIHNSQITQPIIETYKIKALQNEIQKLQFTIEDLRLENKALAEEVVIIRDSNIRTEKNEVIKYQKKYLTEMKEIETYLSLVTERFYSEFAKSKRDKEDLMKWKEENSVYITKLLQENKNIKKDISKLAEVYQSNIDILKHKLKKIKKQYENISENKFTNNYCQYQIDPDLKETFSHKRMKFNTHYNNDC